MAITVFLNAGHGGSDPGAVANGYKEKDLNLKIALACRDELVRHGVNVVMGRTTDVGLTSSDIIRMCNSSGAMVAVDIHINAGGGDGAEVFYTINGGQGKSLASNILNEIKAIGQNSRGIKTRKGSNGTDYYYFIRETSMPAVIVECAFVDNKSDIKIIDTTAEQKKMGVAIAKGILKTLGITYKDSTKENKTPSSVSTFSIKMQRIYKGSSSNTVGQVLTLQRILNELREGKGYRGKDGKKLALDGEFGENTEFALMTYQKAHGLPQTGECDQNDWSKLLCEYKK